MKLILASGSPRRKVLLSLLGFQFQVVEANVDESLLHNETPEAMTLRLAKLKAQTVFDSFGMGHCVLGGDTTVALDGEALGKPESRDHAITLLKRLSGRTHSVFSGVALADHKGCDALVSETRVTFAELSEHSIIRYCAGPDPYDKAGAYGIQGEAGEFVTDIEGSYSGVVGLPLWHTHRLLVSRQQK